LPQIGQGVLGGGGTMMTGFSLSMALSGVREC
jgi:hypothetical protein